MTRLRAGVIGLGIGEQHIFGYRNAGVDVIALCDFDASKREQMSEKYPECTIYASAEELLDDTNIDVVSIASYDDHHASQVIRAIQKGKHVFSEKPLCINEKEVSDINDAIRLHPGIRVSTNTVLRKSARFVDVRDRIQSGELGQIFYAEADYNYGRISKIMSGWRGDIDEYSVMLGGGIHMVDLLIWMIDSPVVEVTAMGNKICSVGSTFHTPDMVAALLRFQNGAIGKVSANFGCVYPHFHKVSIYGTEATFENRMDGGLLIDSRDPAAPSRSIHSDYPGVAKGDLIPDFIRAILGTGNPVISENDMLMTLSTCLAVDESLKSGRPELVKTYSQH